MINKDNESTVLEYLMAIANAARQTTCRRPPGKGYNEPKQPFVGDDVPPIIRYPERKNS